MRRSAGWVVVGIVLAAAPVRAQDGSKYTVKATAAPAPKELKEPIRQLLSDQAIQVADDKGQPFAEIWLRKQVPVKATPEQLKNGLTYREIPETTLLGAVRFAKVFLDYRKQKIKPGVYTLRFGVQPMDGDHMGTAPNPEFCLLVPAGADEKPGTIDVKELQELSNKAPGGTHPGVMLLFPNEKPEEMPKLADKGNGQWALLVKEEAAAGGQKASLGLGITVLGQSSAN
jgi:hypothetical protein